MAVQTMTLPPIFVDQTEFHADPVRRVLSSLLNGKAGFFGDDVVASQIGEDYTVTVSPGIVALPSPTEDYRGVFLAESTTPTTLLIDPPHATQDRVDALVAYAVPPVGDGPGTWCLEVRTGTPSASPVTPVVPGALVIDGIQVPAEASAELPYLSDMRASNGQVYLGGVVLSSVARPSDVRAGTIWIDWQNGNVWAWEGYRWYPAGVPRFDTASERDAAFDDPGPGVLALTQNPYTLWCYTGSSTGWQVVGDTVRASHALGMSATIGTGANGHLTNTDGFAPGRNGGIATVSGQVMALNRAGRWAINVTVFSDAGTHGVSTVRLDWTGGPFTGTNIANTAWRGSGFGGAGSLQQELGWTGNVTTAQASQPIRVLAAWNGATAGNNASYSAAVTLEYLGR